MTNEAKSRERLDLTAYSSLPDRQPVSVTIDERDLIVIRFDDRVSVLSGRCPHRGARLANASVEGERLVCGSHGWDFRYSDGVSPESPEDSLECFVAHVDREADKVWIERTAFDRWAAASPEVFNPDELLI